MEVKRESTSELRCFCAHQPLLCVYGVDRGKIFIHVRIYKANRIYGEILIEPESGSKVRLKCRDCFRWYTVVIRQPSNLVELVEDKSPPSIDKASVH